MRPTTDGADASAFDAGEADAESPDALAEDAEAADAGPDDAGDSWTDPNTLPEAPLASFPMGVAVGDCHEDAAVFWTCYKGARSISLLIWQDGLQSAPRIVPASTASGGYTHVDVDGLIPGARYRYAFAELESGLFAARSPVGQFRAALADDILEPLVIGASACTSNLRDRFRTLEQAGSRSDLDLFILLGDTSYNDGAEDLAAYRTKWTQNLGRDGYRALRRSTSLLATWDDHEVGNNWNPETIAPTQLAVAREVFFEHTPARRDAAEPDRLWHRVRWGRTLEVFVLDSRSERRRSSRLGSDECEYLSRAQMDWLRAGLAASDAVFKIIVNSVPIATMPANFNLGNVLLDPADRWTGYPAQRTELIEHIESSNIAGVIFLSGDYHLAYTGRLDVAGQPGANILEVLAGPGNQVPNPLSFLLRPPQFDFATREMNYATLHLEPATRTLAVRYWGEDGAIIAERAYVV